MEEITIIGAGPSGSYFASRKECTLIEKKKRIGYPVSCTGLVSRNIDKYVKLDREIINQMIDGAIIHSPNKSVTIERKSVAYVLNREKFDKFLLNMAVENSKVHLGEAFLNYKKKEGYYLIKTEKRILKTERLILANGPTGELPYITGLQARVKLKHNSLVELFFGSNICPNFFAWIVPESDNTCRVGLATKQPKPYFDKFIKQLGNPKIIDFQGGLIPLCYNNKVVNDDGIFLLGDRGGMVKATTGGGVVMGLKSARILSEGFENFEKNWKKEVGRQLRLHYKLRSFLNKLDDKRFDELISITESFKKPLEQYGDMDFPLNFATRLLNLKLGIFLLRNFSKLF